MFKFATSAATVPEPYCILGTTLQPFSLGHHLILKRLESPLCGGLPDAFSLPDLLLGVAVCGQPYRVTMEQMLAGQWAREFARWQRQLRGPWWKRNRFSEWDVERAKLLFRRYLADGYGHPPIWSHAGPPGLTLTAPWELVLKNRLVIAGYSEHEVLSGYLPARWYDYYTVSELRCAEKCTDKLAWKKIFYTREDHEQITAKKEVL
ncbi:MAG: hypothetical protein WCO56_26560 [Verrucomicrobiota bacterium]